MINGAKTVEFLHEKSRIVAHNQDERNFHIFYELLAGLSVTEKEKYGLQTAEKYFYLNQGNCFEIDGKDDAEDFRFLIGAMQVLGFTNEEQDIIFRILASILHLGNVYFHRKQFRHGQEGVEIGSDAEIRWVSHLLQIPIEDIFKMLTVRTTETRNERVFTPLNIDQALDMRDAISKLLYVSLFKWLIHRINNIVYKSGARKLKIGILDMFGFENLKENSFEQLCINYANELMYSHYCRCVFRMEQSLYLKEKIDWQNVDFPDNSPVVNLISKKPIGILPLLEDESNFPKSTDSSFLEKCHYNHALNELYSRARMTAAEFGIKHFEGQVWYNVDGFLDKNRNILKSDAVEVLMTSKMPIINKIFHYARELTDTNRQVARNDGRFVTIKPRTPTVSARFQESLNQLFDTASQANSWFIRCIRPNNEREPMKFDDSVVHEQIKHSALLETLIVRKNGYPTRIKYAQFVSRYHSLLTSQLPRGTPSKEITRLILEKRFPQSNGFKFGFSKVFLKEMVETELDKERHEMIVKATIKLQAHARGFMTRRRYRYIKRSAVIIQSAYRGYRQRKAYQTLRKGMIELQATYRMRKQRKEYRKLRALKLKREAERIQREKSIIAAAKEAISKSTSSINKTSDDNRMGIHSLELGNELTSLFQEMENWKCIHSYNDIIKWVKAVIPLRYPHTLPYDIDHHSYAKFTNIYFRSHTWGAKREPIKAPFLQKSQESDFQESLYIFKLILRFMTDTKLSGKKEKLLADYIVQKGLSNINLRDEILCQLCNQTWKNESSDSCDRAWTLMAHCLSSFSPSPLLYKYLLKYVSDHAPNTFRPILQRLLLTCDHVEPLNCRAYPASLLEWKVLMKKCGMSLEVNMANGDSKYSQVDSWTTAEQITSEILKSSGFTNNLFGWTVDFEDNGDIYSLNGDSYVMDMVSQVELSPSFPASKNYFIGASCHNRSRNLLNPFHNAELMNKFNVDGITNHGYEPNGVKQDLFKSNVQRQLNHKMRSMSNDVLMRSDNEHSSSLLGLAVHSKLNERYLKNANSIATFSHLKEMDEEIESSNQALKLSEKSRLNQRYISNKQDPLTKKTSNDIRSNRKNLYTRKSDKQSSKLLNQRSMSMQELGLASSSLNIRYFSREQLNKTASLTGGSDNDSDSLNKVQSLMNFREENSSPNSELGPGQSPNKGFRPHKNMSGRPLPAEPANGDYRSAIHSGGHRKPTHMIRPSSHSSTASSSFESDSSSCLNDTESQLDIENKDNSANARYKKYSNKLSSGHMSKSQPYLNNRIYDRNKDTADYLSIKGSAMSDTSEAPSLASHVRNIRIPSHTSELDQYLDDLFSPVLDANLDDAMSDARSLAQSIKGGNDDEDLKLVNIDTSQVSCLLNSEQLSLALKGGVNEVEVSGHFNCTSDVLTRLLFLYSQTHHECQTWTDPTGKTMWILVCQPVTYNLTCPT